jgi:hypothetical protein
MIQFWPSPTNGRDPVRVSFIGLSVAALLIAPIGSADEFTVEPLVRYALKTERFPGSWGFRDYRRKLERGKLFFDKKRYWSPTDPEGPVLVPCDAKRIGLTYVLRRQKGAPLRVYLLITWKLEWSSGEVHVLKREGPLLFR